MKLIFNRHGYIMFLNILFIDYVRDSCSFVYKRDFLDLIVLYQSDTVQIEYNSL